MSEEATFLREIQANPRDSSLRLVYADWLEEQGDPRSELIRIEDEMRLLPVFEDRFWELKPRRNELRAQSPPDWLVSMGYGTTCHPVFRHGWPDGVKERWRVIRELVDRCSACAKEITNGQSLSKISTWPIRRSSLSSGTL